MKLGTVAAIAAPAALLVGLFGIVFLTAATATCGDQAARVETVPAGPVAGFSGADLQRAADIMNAAQTAGLPVKAQVLGVMVAIAESALDDPLPPRFFEQLAAIPGWRTLDPAIAANTIIGNPDPHSYSAAYPGAQALVSGLTGTATSGPGCGVGAPGAVAASGWANPASGSVSSGYGFRIDAWTGGRKLHAGVDIAAACGTPIYAAKAGTVIFSGPIGGYGTKIDIDHGDGLTTRYGHMYQKDLYVKAGDQVFAGENIALIGTVGKSTGCHLHFETRKNGASFDPSPFLTALGVSLGSK